jgi:hypothetical protein
VGGKNELLDKFIEGLSDCSDCVDEDVVGNDCYGEERRGSRTTLLCLRSQVLLPSLKGEVLNLRFPVA